MTGNKVLLDTNIISALLKGEPGIADKIDSTKSVFIPVIALGELYYGASYSKHVNKNTRNAQKIAQSYPLLLVDEETAVKYGSIKAALRKKGTPIPENDIWIAAIALQHDLTVITRDKHFKEVDGLSIQNW